MSEKTVVITEKNGEYSIQNNGISDFALLGILECVVFDLKSSPRSDVQIKAPEAPQKAPQETAARDEKQSESTTKPEITPKSETAKPESAPPQTATKPEAAPTPEAAAPPSNNPELRTRIANAVKAIRGLGGKIEDIAVDDLTDEELQSELEELTGQYKRLKSSKATK